MSKCHIVGNVMSRLNYVLPLIYFDIINLTIGNRLTIIQIILHIYSQLHVDLQRMKKNILCTISLAISYVLHLFSAHLCAMPINFNCNEQDLRQLKLRNFRRHPLNRHLGKARNAEGVSLAKITSVVSNAKKLSM